MKFDLKSEILLAHNLELVHRLLPHSLRILMWQIFWTFISSLLFLKSFLLLFLLYLSHFHLLYNNLIFVFVRKCIIRNEILVVEVITVINLLWRKPFPFICQKLFLLWILNWVFYEKLVQEVVCLLRIWLYLLHLIAFDNKGIFVQIWYESCGVLVSCGVDLAALPF